MPSDGPEFWLTVPVATTFLVTSRFNDPRAYPNNPDKKQRHEGIDLNAVDASGRPVAVLAAQRGVVDKVGNYPPGYGLYVRIRHPWPDGHTYVTWYGHLSEIHVSEGDFVAVGQNIGVAGDTGYAFGIHLHLTLQDLGHGLKNYVVDDVVDPYPYFRFGPPPTVEELSFVTDETVPDGTIMQPGQPFPKTWRVRNSGSTTWGPGYQLAFTSGEQMGAPARVPLPALEPGEEGTLTVNLTAPTKAGRYQSVWQARTPDGQLFPWELFADIVVAAPRRDDARFLADVTVPDGTPVAPGQTFLKTWRVRNSGTTTWNNGYRLAFVEDERMAAPDNLPVPFTRPDQEAEISVTLQAPEAAGTHHSTWRLRNPAGELFGDFLYALIQVERQEVPEEGVDEMSYVDDVTIEDGTLILPGRNFEKVWRVRNSGTTTWGPGHELVFFADEQMGGPASIPLPAASPGETVDITLQLTAPTLPGRYRSTWKGRNPQGSFFEYAMYAEIEVVQSAGAADLVDDAKFVRDLTIPDGTVVQAGESFLKTWRLRNTGTTTWGPGYELAFIGDDPMGEGEPVPLPRAAPGQEVNISVRLTAPLVPGSHQSTWRPRNPQGEFFGHQFFALISVPTPIPPTDQRAAASLVEHTTFPPGSDVKVGQAIKKMWRVRNTGTTTWAAGYTLAFLEGDPLGGVESIPVPPAAPQATVRLSLPLIIPETPGNYRGVWKLRDPQGNFFGPRLVVSLRAKE